MVKPFYRSLAVAALSPVALSAAAVPIIYGFHFDDGGANVLVEAITTDGIPGQLIVHNPAIRRIRSRNRLWNQARSGIQGDTKIPHAGSGLETSGYTAVRFQATQKEMDIRFLDDGSG